MASIAWVTLIIMMLVDCTQLKQEQEPLFGAQGGQVSFPFMSSLRRPVNFFAVLYRSTAKGSVFLINTSDPSQHSGSEQAERLGYYEGNPYIRIQNLSLSDAGDYKTERWGKGKIKEKRFYHLTVCKDDCNDRVQSEMFRWSVKNISHVNTLQAYKRPFEKYFQGPVRTSLVVDTTRSPEVLPGDQSSGIKVSRFDSTVVIYHSRDKGATYYLLIWHGGQCCLSKTDIYEAEECAGSSKEYKYFLKLGQALTLPCGPAGSVTNYTEEVVWKTPVRVLSVDVGVSGNLSLQEAEDMHIETSNYSLVIPSVEAKHVGRYECQSDYNRRPQSMKVFVCSDLDNTIALFSPGDTADLVCHAELNVSWAKGTFYGHLRQDQEQFSLKPEYMRVLDSEWKKGRTWSYTMSNLTLNDSGLYFCRIWGYTEEGNHFCYDRKIYLLHKHPFGIDSTFYRVYSSLMACGLLGMTCAVISVHLRLRGRDQAPAESSGRPTREGRQSGGEPEYDDVCTPIDIRE